MTSTCTNDVAVQTNTTPHAFPFPLLLMVSWKVMGPKRSTAVDSKTGAGPMRCSGKGAIFCVSRTFVLLLQVKHPRLMLFASFLARTIHAWALLRIVMLSTPPWSIACASPRINLDRG